ncbi:unnamed protein product, partial [Effrenium voratum]
GHSRAGGRWDDANVHQARACQTGAERRREGEPPHRPWLYLPPAGRTFATG